MHKSVRWLAIVATVVMGLVLLQGTLVTNTGSQYGCGNTWPLCRGKLIPELKGLEGISTLIEFSHRAVVPVESTLILLLAGALVWYWRGRREVKILAPSLVFFLVLQAVLGGLAVMFPTSAGVLALHFGVSLLAFASVLLATSFILELGEPETVRDRPISRQLRLAIWATLGYVYFVVYLGAYVRHVGASLSCLDWPLCNGQVIPRFVEGVGAQFAHRVAAGLSVLLIIWLFMQIRAVRASRPDLYRGAQAAAILVVLQSLSGGLVVKSGLNIYTTLLHSLLITLLFGALSYLCFHTLPLPARARAAQRDRERVAVPASGSSVRI